MINKNNLKVRKNSIKNVYKITKSMEMISIYKYKLIYKKLYYNIIYNNILNQILNRFDIYLLNQNNIFFYKFNNNNINNILYLVISSDQGLCGSLNLNLYKKIIYHIKKNNFIFKKIYFFLIGKKTNFFLNILKKNNIIFKVLYKKKLYKILNDINKEITNKIINFFKINNSIVFIVNNILLSNNNKINIDQLLPINTLNKYNKFSYLYETNNEILINELIYEHINSKINNCILNNMVSEYFNRIKITKNASINSENLFNKLNLIYNKLRQFCITKEIIELISNI